MGMILVSKGQEPVGSVGERPGNDGVALLVVSVTVLQLPLGGGGTVAHPSPLALLLIVVLELPCLTPIFQVDTLQRKNMKGSVRLI